jgi:hypothetical protein
MSHYAKVDQGKVVNIIVAEAEFFNNFVDTSPGTYVQCSYNTRGNVHYGNNGQPDGGVPLRGNYPSIGWTYDSRNDVFYAPQPYPSWTLNTSTWQWQPPVPYPTPVAGSATVYQWNESTQSWDNKPITGSKPQ